MHNSVQRNDVFRQYHAVVLSRGYEAVHAHIQQRKEPEVTDKPEVTDEPETTEDPELEISEILYGENGKPYMTVTNNGDADIDIDIYTASYDETGMLVGIDVISVPAAADGKPVMVTLDAAAGNRVFVWDKGMKPLSGVMTVK